MRPTKWRSKQAAKRGPTTWARTPAARARIHRAYKKRWKSYEMKLDPPKEKD